MVRQWCQDLSSNNLERLAEQVASILSKLDNEEIWMKIIENEPEWKIIKEYKIDEAFQDQFGKFALIMISTALNDYYLGGESAKDYWERVIKRIACEKEKLRKLKNADFVKRLAYLYAQALRGSKPSCEKYGRSRDRLVANYDAKLWRLFKFFLSPLPHNIVEMKIDDFRNTEALNKIWEKLAIVMGQDKNAKTITFAMKTIEIALLMRDVKILFDFTIPIDFRIKSLTHRLTSCYGIGELGEVQIQRFWEIVIYKINKKLNNVKIGMVYLDSLLWQLDKNPEGVKNYFKKLANNLAESSPYKQIVIEVGEKLEEIINCNR